MRITRIALLACFSLGLFLHLSTSSGQAPSTNNPQAEATGEPRFDGPAELPRLHVRSAMADTPAPGRTILVKEGDDLQAAMDAAKCGDVLSLQAGATFAGLYRFPKKPCDDSHWIIVRTSAPDSSLPPEGSRMTPCYAGIASVPGRPDFHCPAPRNVLAKIVLDRKALAGPVLFSDGANHYRFLGLEITRGMPEFHMRNLVQPEDVDTTAHHLIFDRLWLHGTPQDETKDGIHLSGTTYVAIVDSYFSDFKCIAFKGSCTDAQAINGGTFDAPGGPWKIENNFLEASGQSIMFGGARGTTTPADIEIRRNHLFKPMIWKPGEPGFVGGYTGNPFIVKNNFELKNAQRVLFEGNILENSWGGFTQTGFSILLNPGNQGGHCPQCRVNDITVRYNRVAHVGNVLSLATVPGKGRAGAAAGGRYSIHDLLVDDVDAPTYKGLGLFAFVADNDPPVSDIRIDHVTAFPTRGILTFTNRTGAKIPRVSVTNSIFTAGLRQIGLAGGGAGDCSALPFKTPPATVLNLCFSDSVITHNIIIDGRGEWPAGNIMVNDAKAAGLVDFRNGHGGDYRLCSGKNEPSKCEKASPALRKGNDGKDIGADIDAIEKATAGVILGR